MRICPPQFKEDSSSTLWIRPLFSLLWFYPLYQGRFVFSDYKIHPLLLNKAWLYGGCQFLCLDLFWHTKEAAASTFCLTGFPCRFFRFPMTGPVLFSCFIFIVKILFWVVSGVFSLFFLQTQYAPKALNSSPQSFCQGSCNSCWG